MRYCQKSPMGLGLLLVLLPGFFLFVHAPLFAAEIHVSLIFPPWVKRISMNGSVRVRFNFNIRQKPGEPC